MKFLISFFFFSSLLFSEVVQLTPPSITKETVSELIVSHRPVRKGGVLISRDKREEKTIIHCYGHGGLGWSMLFGSVKKAIETFEETLPGKETPIHIVGAGCMGLGVAIELAHLGYNVKGISSKELFCTSSWNAGGLFEMCKDHDISFDTLAVYLKIFKGEHPYLSVKGIKVLPVYIDKETAPRFGFQPLVDSGFIPTPKEVTIDFGNGVTHEDFLEYQGFFLEPATLMQELMEEVKRLQIPIIQQKIESFSALEEPYVFNCSGLGARELNDDLEVYGATGCLVALNEKGGIEHMNYILCTRVLQNDQMERVHLFPKEHLADSSGLISIRGVLGGTYHPHGDQLPADKLDAFYQKNYEAILNRTSLFFQGHRFKK